MAKQSKTEFERWINGVPVGDYLDIRARIMQETGVSRTTFSSCAKASQTLAWIRRSSSR